MIELLLEAERALSFGLVDRAEQLYRQVADHDPRNSIAVVGLARVALERADDLGAYLLARRALGIDPENEAAQRLATRLEEVMRTRGDTMPDLPPLAAPSRSVVPPTMAPKPPAGRGGPAVGEGQAVSPEPAQADPRPAKTAPGPAERPADAAPARRPAAPKRPSLLDRIRRR